MNWLLLYYPIFPYLYWLLGISVQKEALWLVIVSLFLSARGNSGIEIVGESTSTTRENKEVLAADSYERHAQTAGESCKRQLQA
jgi:phage gp45-like